MSDRTPTMGRRMALVLAVAATGLLLSGCVVAPAQPVYTTGEVYAPMAPPPPRYEVVPVLPFPGAIWISGYWNWSGGHHVWVPGRYMAPRPGYQWRPHQWAPRPGGGWALHGGQWAPPGRPGMQPNRPGAQRPVPRPPTAERPQRQRNWQQNARPRPDADAERGPRGPQNRGERRGPNGGGRGDRDHWR